MPGLSDFEVRGLVSAPCTPFDAEGELNLSLIPRYVEHLVEYGVPNVFITGSVGEGFHMTLDERKKVAQAWVDAGLKTNKLRHVIVHIGGNNYKEGQELAKHAREIGASAVASMGPSYFKPETIECYVDYIAKIASAVPDMPFLLYDIDFMTGIKYSAIEFFRAAKDKIPNLVGTKHTSPNFSSMHRIILEMENKFQVVLGSDELFLEGLTLGIHTTVLSSYVAKYVNRCKEAFDKGDIVTARKEQEEVLKIASIRDQYGLSGPAATKAFLRVMGLPVGNPRLPLAAISDEILDRLKKDLIAAGYGDIIAQ